MPRQGKNIYQRKDGRWEGRYSKGKIDGKTRYGYVFGKTYEEAEKKLEAAKGSNPSPGLVTTSFENVASEWLLQQQPELKASSYSKYTNMLQLYLNPKFGKIAITDILRSEVQQFSKDLLVKEERQRPGLLRKRSTVLSPFLKTSLNMRAKSGDSKLQI